MLRGRRERASSSASSGSSRLIPPNPAIADPGSSPISRGGILLNPIAKDGSQTTALPSARTSSTSSSSTKRSSSLGSRIQQQQQHYYKNSGRRSTSHSSSTFSNDSNNNEEALSITGSSDETSSISSATSVTSPRLKFAPLPESGRIKRSNSITLGVAARAQMLQSAGVGGGGGGSGGSRQYSGASQPHWQQQVAPVTPMWYNGGPMPDNVKTLKDLKPGLKKAWGAITRRRSTSASSSQSNSSVTGGEDSNTSTDGGGEGAPQQSLPSAMGGESEVSSRGYMSSNDSDIGSIHEEDESEHLDDNIVGSGSDIKLTGEGLVVNHPPGSGHRTTPAETGGRPIQRMHSDAMSSCLSDTSESSDVTDLDSRDAVNSAQALSTSPAYTLPSGASVSGQHFYPRHGHGHAEEATTSGEATPRRGHSPPSSPGVGGSSNHNSKNSSHHHPQHWTPVLADGHPHTTAHAAGGHHHHTGGYNSGSAPGSGANTPRRRMSMGDMTLSSSGTHSLASSGNNNTNDAGHRMTTMKGHPEIYGFDEAQLKNRLGAMDLNSRRRRPHMDDEDGRRGNEEGEEDDNSELSREEDEEEDDEEVPLPEGNRQVHGAGLELTV